MCLNGKDEKFNKFWLKLTMYILYVQRIKICIYQLLLNRVEVNVKFVKLESKSISTKHTMMIFPTSLPPHIS